MSQGILCVLSAQESLSFATYTAHGNPIMARGEIPHSIDVLPTSVNHDEYDCEQINTSVTPGDLSNASSDVDSSTQDKKLWQSGVSNARLSTQLGYYRDNNFASQEDEIREGNYEVA